MHSIIKNRLSKVLALTVLFTNFSTVLASSESSLDLSRALNNPTWSIDDINLITLNFELEKLKKYNVFATDALISKVGFDIKLRILQQLNALFENYRVFAGYFVNYLEYTKVGPGYVTEGKFMIDVMPDDLVRSAKKNKRYLGANMLLGPKFVNCMRFNCTGEYADVFRNHVEALSTKTPKYSSDKCIEFQVSHEFGHCLQWLYMNCHTSQFKQSEIETQRFIQSQLGTKKISKQIGTRWQTISQNPIEQAREFFADFFAYVQCGKDVPANYKTVLEQVINCWFPARTIINAIPNVKAQSTPEEASKKAPVKESKAASPQASSKPLAKTAIKTMDKPAATPKRNVAANADAKSKFASEPKKVPGEESKAASPQASSKPFAKTAIKTMNMTMGKPAATPKRNVAANADAKSKFASELKKVPGEESKAASPQPGSKPAGAKSSKSTTKASTRNGHTKQKHKHKHKKWHK